MKAIPCPIAPAALADLYTTQKLTDQEIVDVLVSRGYGDVTVKRVSSWRKRLGIETIPRWSRNEVLPIDGRLRSLLVGSMLGDGRLVHRTHATHYTECHSSKQEEYLRWKVEQWGSWVLPNAGKPVTWKTGGKEYEGFRFNTVSHDLLNDWRDLFYENRTKGWKRLTPEVVGLVDEFALAVWYLDDGYAGWWPDITFGMDPGSRGIAYLIFEKFGLTPRWATKSGKTGNFHLEREDTAHRFIELIRPHVPECMSYKLEFGFQGSHYKVRNKLQEETLRELAAQGVPIRRIARDLGVGASTVSRHLKKLDIPHPRKVGNPGKSL